MAKKAEKKKKTTTKTAAKKTTAKKSSSPKTKKVKAEKKLSTTKTKTSEKKMTVKKTTKPATMERKKEKKKPIPKGRKKAEIPPDLSKVEMENSAEIRAKALSKIKGYNKKDLEHFKNVILGKRDEIIEQLQNLKDQMLDPTTGEYINENSPYSLHMAEQGTDAMEREKTFLYAQRENKFLGYLEDALKRIEAGTYGICIECIEEPQHLCETCPLIPKA
ncbi:MAG: conjugal transfer protein TraR, partial [Ignavibacteriaceae bacterium]